MVWAGTYKTWKRGLEQLAACQPLLQLAGHSQQVPGLPGAQMEAWRNRGWPNHTALKLHSSETCSNIGEPAEQDGKGKRPGPEDKRCVTALSREPEIVP